MTQYAFYYDSDRCTGCKTCQVACKETYGLPVGNLWRKVYRYCGGSWTPNETTGHFDADNVFGYFMSISCNHCDNPACMASCPAGAITKDEDTGIVWIDKDVCIGCRTCETACPYGAPTFIEDEGVVTKCDMCKDLIADGGVPLCVSACPMRALDFGLKEDLIAKYGEGNVEIEPLPANTTGPNLILNPHRNAQATGSGTGQIVNLAEEL